MSTGTAYLMYHELHRAGRALCRREEGYTRYVISRDRFKSHLDTLKTDGFDGLSVTQHLGERDSSGKNVVFTFDDGCETDLLLAAPLLMEHGFSATFYVVSGWIGQPGFLSGAQLRELASLGFEIGSHSRTHPFLPDLNAQQMHEEIGGSKYELEQMIGAPVRHFSCPGGRWSHNAIDEAKASGYESFALSRVGLNSAASYQFALARVAVKSNTTANTVLSWAEGKGLLRMQAMTIVLDAGKRLLGNGLYEKVRGAVLGSE